MNSQSIRVGETFPANVALESIFLVVRSNVDIEISFVDEDFCAAIEVTSKLFLLCVSSEVIVQVCS